MLFMCWKCGESPSVLFVWENDEIAMPTGCPWGHEAKWKVYKEVSEEEMP